MNNKKSHTGMLVAGPLLLGAVLSSLQLSGGSAAIGLVARGVETTVGGTAVRPNSALFHGDVLEVRENGVAVIRLNQGGGMTLSDGALASFSRDAEGVTVLLERGSVQLAQPAQGRLLRVKAGNVAVEPARGYPTMGEVALRDSQLSVRAREGRLCVLGKGVELEATKGRAVTLNTGSANAGKGAGAGAAAAGGAAAKAAGVAAAATGASVAVAQGMSKEKNPIAVERVGANIPPHVCERAASPSVPAAACEEE